MKAYALLGINIYYTDYDNIFFKERIPLFNHILMDTSCCDEKENEPIRMMHFPVSVWKLLTIQLHYNHRDTEVREGEAEKAEERMRE